MEPGLRDSHGRPLIPVLEAAAISGFTPGYIRRLLQNKVIPGVKIGRDWFTTAEAVQEYLEQGRRPGRPRK